MELLLWSETQCLCISLLGGIKSNSMKKDLSGMLKGNLVWGFENLESAREYLAKYLISYIHIELETLPKQEWDKTLKTWAKICEFSKSLIPKSDEERQKLYQGYKFDQMMIGIAEDVRHTLIGAMSLGILGKEDKPYKVILKGVELILERDDLISNFSLKREILEYIRQFFLKLKH